MEIWKGSLGQRMMVIGENWITHRRDTLVIQTCINFIERQLGEH